MRIFLVLICLVFFLPSRAARLTISAHDSELVCQIADAVSKADTAGLNHQIWKHKKIVAAVLSFPLPFGWLGLHRIYMGTAPWVPIAYVVTFGGCVGILPLIDFVVILIKKPEELKMFFNNNKIFMWE